MGSAVEYEVEIGGHSLTIINTDPRHTTIYKPGQEIGLKLLTDCLYILA